MPTSNKRRVKAAEKYCQEVYILQHLNYSWQDALRAAGYGERYIHSHGASMWLSVAVKQVIDKYKAQQQQTAQDKIDEIRAEHRRLQRLAEKKGDLATATANATWYGKTYGAYTDVVRNDHEQQQQQRLTEQEQAELRRIAGIRLKEMA